MKQVKYSGKTKCNPGELLVWQDDGSVITIREVNIPLLAATFVEFVETKLHPPGNLLIEACNHIKKLLALKTLKVR